MSLTPVSLRLTKAQRGQSLTVLVNGARTTAPRLILQPGYLFRLPGNRGWDAQCQGLSDGCPARYGY